MFDAVLLAYLACVCLVAILVGLLPVPVFNENLQLTPISGLVILVWLLSPVFLAGFAPEYIRMEWFPVSAPDGLERAVQVLAAIIAFYITIRGIILWRIFMFIGIIYVVIGVILHGENFLVSFGF